MSLALADISHSYDGTPVLTGVSLEAASGECVALVGESGAGKTTLLRCSNRLVVPARGTVTVNGEVVAGMDPVLLRRHTGYVPQDGGLLPHWTVARNAATVPWLLGMADADARGRRALARTGLDPDEFGERLPGRLSGGQRQRVAFARAIAADAPLVLLDEPFGALDAVSRAELHDLLLALRRELGFTALLVTHDLHEALHLADRVAVMRAGRIEQLATPDDLIAAPATPYVRLLLERARVA